MKTQTQKNSMTDAEKQVKYLEEELLKQLSLRVEDGKIMAEQQVKVRFADALAGCEGSIGVQEMAHMLYQSGIDIGETRLYQWLRVNGFAYRQPGGRNMPSQKALEMGVLELQKYVRMNADGRCSADKRLLVTPKGQQYLLQVFHMVNEENAAK